MWRKTFRLRPRVVVCAEWKATASSVAQLASQTRKPTNATKERGHLASRNNCHVCFWSRGVARSVIEGTRHGGIHEFRLEAVRVAVDGESTVSSTRRDGTAAALSKNIGQVRVRKSIAPCFLQPPVKGLEDVRVLRACDAEDVFVSRLIMSKK